MCTGRHCKILKNKLPTEDWKINVYPNFNKSNMNQKVIINILDDKEAHLVTLGIFNHIKFMQFLSH